MSIKMKEEHKKAVVDDFAFAVKMMKQSKMADEKLFYFSSTFGTISRIINSVFDSRLALIHMVLTTVHATILSRVGALKAGDQSVSLNEELFEKLATYVEELGSRIVGNGDISEALEKVSLCAFATTGNGYYLWKKGAFNI